MPTRRARRLAAPVVVTIAALPACTPAPSPDIHVNPPPQHVDNPPALIDASAPTAASVTVPVPVANPPPPIHVNPPPPIHVNPPPQQLGTDLPPPSGKGRVEQLPNGTCEEYPDLTGFKCQPGFSCNPPPPHPVRCPRGRASAP